MVLLDINVYLLKYNLVDIDLVYGISLAELLKHSIREI